MNWTLLTVAIVAEVAGTLGLRLADGSQRPWWLALTFVGYAVAFTLLAVILRSGTEIGTLYAIWAAAGICLVAVAGWLIWDDRLSTMTVIGLATTVVGVVLVEQGARHV